MFTSTPATTLLVCCVIFFGSCFFTNVSTSSSSSSSSSTATITNVEAFKVVFHRSCSINGIHPLRNSIPNNQNHNNPKWKNKLFLLLERRNHKHTTTTTTTILNSLNDNNNNNSNQSSYFNFFNDFIVQPPSSLSFSNLLDGIKEELFVLVEQQEEPPPNNLTYRSIERITQQQSPPPDVTHFCFLIHGHRGLSKDLQYMETAMQKFAAIEKKKQERKRSKNGESKELFIHDMVVHNTICNEYKTKDGIEKGGDRLVEEMLQVIQTEMEKRYLTTTISSVSPTNATKDTTLPSPSEPTTTNPTPIHDITISILGNSLGGLFGRYAIAKLIERHCIPEPQPTTGTTTTTSWILVKGNYRVHLNIFITTATPHLGISKHTYVKLPRRMELTVARILGDTGKDLFRVNDLLHTMATCPSYLVPLATFKKRIAYANAYNTDFPVPPDTAAFLSKNSSYPHFFINATTRRTHQEEEEEDKDGQIVKIEGQEEYYYDEDDDDNDHKRYIIAAFHTPTEEEHINNILSSNNNRIPKNEDHDNDIVTTYDNNDTGSRSTRSSASIHTTNSSSSINEYDDDDDYEVELHRMSLSLDKLGWKKVFIDIREEIPSIEIPEFKINKLKWSILKQNFSSYSSFFTSSSDDFKRVMSRMRRIGRRNGEEEEVVVVVTDSNYTDAITATEEEHNPKNDDKTTKKNIHIFRKSNPEKGMQSKDVALAVSKPPSETERIISLPLGHNTIIAFSRSPISTFMNKGGRPIVNALAKEVIEDIFKWQKE